MQTLFFGVIGRFYVPQSLPGERHSVTVPDGSTVLYDFYSPTEALSAPNMIYIVVPGVCDSPYLILIGILQPAELSHLFS